MEQNVIYPFLGSNSCTCSNTDSQTVSHSNHQRVRSPKPGHVSAAASLPNLNHAPPPHAPQTNVDLSYPVQNNMHSARILESGLNNSIHCQQNTASDHVNNTVLHNVVGQTLPSQIWNGPAALNNQVAPGNRANNYWDNFRR